MIHFFQKTIQIIQRWLHSENQDFHSIKDNILAIVENF